MTELRISVRNTSDVGGTALTPFFTAFHDNSFDIYDLGGLASPGLEALAEDGNNGVFADELLAADADGQSINVAAARGPIAPRELASATITVDGASNGWVGLASMLLPSNDAFVGTANAIQLYDADGNFMGAQLIQFDGASVRDAGTEENTEMDAAFINQTAPNTGVTENEVITVHPGFNGSVGNPGGDQIILGGTNAFGDFIDPATADFTLEGAQIANVHINAVARQTGDDDGNTLTGAETDDLIDAGGGDDVVTGGEGWDVLSGEAGDDRLFGGAGDDVLDGGEGSDFLTGGTGNDDLMGGAGRDFISGGAGDDILSGGAGQDFLLGGAGNDLIMFSSGDDKDFVLGFDRSGDDRIVLDVESLTTFAEVQAASSENILGTTIDAGDGDSIFLLGVRLADLSEDDFVF